MNRPMKSLIFFFVPLLVLTNVAASLADEEPSAFKISARQPKDQITVQSKDEKAIFSITSPSGIGSATIERTDQRWPNEVVLQVHLHGLESFSISNGTVKLAASVLSHSDNLRLLHLWKEGKEGPRLDKSSPFWTAIEIVGAKDNAAQKIPLERGYFQLVIPKALLAGNPKSISLSWINFYR